MHLRLLKMRLSLQMEASGEDLYILRSLVSRGTVIRWLLSGGSNNGFALHALELTIAHI